MNNIAKEIFKMLQKWMDSREASEYLGTTKDWLLANVHKLGIPHIRLGRQYRFRLSDLELWAKQNLVNGKEYSNV